MQFYGGQVEEFALETRGQTGLGFEYSATQRLYLRRGQIWSLPEDETSTHGLSGGITYAWDPQLCGQLLPLMRENVANLISCDDLKASLQRGFDAWAMNSRHIKFVDVSTACEKQYTLTKDCPLAEVWVAALSCEFVSALCEDNPNTDASSLTWAAAATPKFALSNSFRFTNGEYNKVGNVVQPSIEIVGGTLLFNIGTPAAPGMCWYLDSAFCSNFHAMKASFPGSTPAVQAANAKVVIIVLFWTIWLSTIALFLYNVFWVFTPRKAFWDELKEALEDGILDGEDMKELEEARKQYIKNTMKRIAKYETIAVAFIITVIVGLPLLYWQLFLPCWDCYDFEGAAVHEAGERTLPSPIRDRHRRSARRRRVMPPGPDLTLTSPVSQVTCLAWDTRMPSPVCRSSQASLRTLVRMCTTRSLPKDHLTIAPPVSTIGTQCSVACRRARMWRTRQACVMP